LNGLQNLAYQISEYVGADSSIQIEQDILELDKKLCEIVENIEACKNISEQNNKLQAAHIATISKTNDIINNVKEVKVFFFNIM
jgi:hypothetical protein